MATLSAIPQNAYITTGNGQVCLNWDVVVGATSYQIQRSLDGVNYTNLAAPVVNFYVDSAVTPGVLYYYQVASISVAGTSNFNAFGTNSLPLSIVPCLPAQIPLNYLRQQAKNTANKLKSQFVTNDEWNFNINQSMYELYDLLVSKYSESYFFAPPLIIALNGSISYPVPDGSNYPVNGVPAPAMLKLNGIDVNISGGQSGPNAGWVPLSRTNWSDRDRYTTFPGQAGALNNIYQMGYAEMGNQIYLFPQNMNMSVRIWYVPIMTQLLLDTDMLSFSLSGWSQYIILDAAIKTLVKEESFDQANVLQGLKNAITQRIEYAANNRDVGQPPSVSNTRAVMGDPGFSGWQNGMGMGSGWGGGGW